VLTDEKWFCFVLEQILSNALKYTKQGSVKISAEETENGLQIFVKDTGIGIKREDLPRIFEKGFTGYNGRMDKKASGLGLYLCKGVCEKLGHEIRVVSEEGEGTTVILTLQLEKVQQRDLVNM
jgi:signal transduction histidine kinase